MLDLEIFIPWLIKVSFLTHTTHHQTKVFREIFPVHCHTNTYRWIYAKIWSVFFVDDSIILHAIHNQGDFENVRQGTIVFLKKFVQKFKRFTNTCCIILTASKATNFEPRIIIWWKFLFKVFQVKFLYCRFFNVNRILHGVKRWTFDIWWYHVQQGHTVDFNFPKISIL